MVHSKTSVKSGQLNKHPQQAGTRLGFLLLSKSSMQSWGKLPVAEPHAALPIFMPFQTRVAAVIVTYHPDFSALEQLLASLQAQVEKTLIVDNGSPSEHLDWLQKQAGKEKIILPLEQNLGVATALNLAIRWAQVNGFTHVILFDQDSLPETGMVATLLSWEEAAVSSGARIAAVGPRYYDPRHSCPAPFIRFDGWKIHKIGCTEKLEVHEASYLITSGSLIRLSVLEEVGLMDEALFIDYIDVEWGLRAQSKGYRCFGLDSARMRHSLGDEVVTWGRGRKSVSVRSPLRNYYLCRNALLIYRRSHIPLNWVLNDAWRLLLKFAFFTLITPPRLQNLKMMTLGLWHGFRGGGGKYLERRAEP